MKIMKFFWQVSKCPMLLAFFTLMDARLVRLQENYDCRNEKVVICGVCKNVAVALPIMIKKIEKLGEEFKDYAVIIYENNSTDESKNQLLCWARNNKKVQLISEDLTYEQLCTRTIAHAKRDGAPCRMELIAYARNQVLNVALSEKFDDFKFVIMTDLDFLEGWSALDVVETLKTHTPWDCIAANCMTRDTRYYDRYAFRDEDFPFGPEFIGEDFWQEANACSQSFDRNGNFKKVFSAFGGLAIFKRDALKGCEYSGYVTNDLKLFYKSIINKLSSEVYNKYKHNKNIRKAQTDPEISFMANSGYDGPVVCEHCTLYASMILSGHDQIFINPKMICIY